MLNETAKSAKCVGHGRWSQTARAQALARETSSCVVLGKIPIFPVPLFLICKMDNNSTHLLELF